MKLDWLIHFLNQLPKAVKDSLTLADGATYDVGRILGVTGFTVFFGLAIYDCAWLKNAFNAQNFGIGAGALATGLGAMLSLKNKTEPRLAEDKDVSPSQNS